MIYFVVLVMERIGKIVGLIVMIIVVVFLFKDGQHKYTPSIEQEIDSSFEKDHLSDIVFLSGFVVNSGEQRDSSTFSDQLSVSPAVEEILLESDLSISDLSSNNIWFLKKVFSTNSDPQVMNMIIQLMIDEYQFLGAKQFIEQLSDEQRINLDPLLHLQVLFNSFSLSSTTTFSSLSDILQNYLNWGKISQEQYQWYSGILSLMQRDYSRFFDLSRSFSTDSYRTFSQKLSSLQGQISQQSDMPAYYFDALVGVELFNQGFFQISKVLALSVVSQNKEYILPYQILAYANFLTASWDAAIEYFTLLKTLNPQASDKYSFLIGVAYYWNWAYEKSVLQLSQIKTGSYRLDVERYLVLNYLILQQPDKLLSTWQKLLWSKDLMYTDFFNYFFQTFFVPYSKWEEYFLYQKNSGLAQNYLTVCSQTLKGSEKAVCEYGKVWLSLANNSFEWLEVALVSLTENYPQGYLYHALWEFYLKQWKPDLAKSALLKAIWMSSSMEEWFKLKSLLQQVM